MTMCCRGVRKGNRYRWNHRCAHIGRDGRHDGWKNRAGFAGNFGGRRIGSTGAVGTVDLGRVGQRVFGDDSVQWSVWWLRLGGHCFHTGIGSLGRFLYRFRMIRPALIRLGVIVTFVVLRGIRRGADKGVEPGTIVVNPSRIDRRVAWAGVR